MYLASIGILGSLGWGVWRVMGSRGKERFPGSVRAVLACGVVGLAILTYIRNEVYSRETSLWRDTVKTRPQNVRARVSLSSALLREGNPSLAEGFARSAIEMLPDFSSRSAVKHGMTGSSAFERKELYQVGLYVIAHNDLGIALFQQGKAALATNAYACALAVMPGFESAKENMALAMGSLGKQIEALEIWIDLAKMATERGDIPRVQVCLTNAERELVQSTLPSERVKHFSDQISEMRTRIKVWSD
jgi:tetratricopeptide (TPR) repeat protein